MLERITKSAKEAGKYALPAVFIGIGVYALASKEYFIAAAGGLLGWLKWPKKETGAGAHMTSLRSIGGNRVLESSSSMKRITQAQEALPKAA